MKRFAISGLIGVLALGLFSVAQAKGRSVAQAKEPEVVRRGRYLVQVMGCNDCHTPMYGMKEGQVAESEWLSGVPVGWNGPWGTTYATNLRKRVAGMTEGEWVSYLKNLRSRPPMPWFAVNIIEEKDMKAMYHYIRSLGDHPQEIPAALPPKVEPATPYINFDVVMPTRKN